MWTCQVPPPFKHRWITPASAFLRHRLVRPKSRMSARSRRNSKRVNAAGRITRVSVELKNVKVRGAKGPTSIYTLTLQGCAGNILGWGCAIHRLGWKCSYSHNSGKTGLKGCEYDISAWLQAMTLHNNIHVNIRQDRYTELWVYKTWRNNITLNIISTNSFPSSIFLLCGWACFVLLFSRQGRCGPVGSDLCLFVCLNIFFVVIIFPISVFR